MKGVFRGRLANALGCKPIVQASIPGRYKLKDRFSLLPATHELCESRGGRPGFPVPNSPYGLKVSRFY